MIIDIPLTKIGKTRRTLRFVDVNKEQYNILVVIEKAKGNQWEFGEIQILGHVNKLDIKRLAKAS